MIHPRTAMRLIPLLALSVTFALATSVQAQEHHDSGDVSATLQVSFGSTPHWTTVRGTSVREIRQSERPDYDMFRYAGNYYVYNNGHWYMSRHDRGAFRVMDERRVPNQLSRVPREHWRNYPTDWADRNHKSADRHGRSRYADRNAQPGNGGHK